jgi:hypothetical protein
MNLHKYILILWAILFSCCASYAQEENGEVAQNATRYVDLRIKSLEKYNRRFDRQQKHLLGRLKRKERKFAQQLKRDDSAGYAVYKTGNVSFDSLSSFANCDTCRPRKFVFRNNSAIDSLKQITRLAQNDTATLDSKNSFESKLTDLDNSLAKKAYTSDLAERRMKWLKGLTNRFDAPNITGMEKCAFYTNSRIKAYRELESEPDKLEEMSLEYLQGTKDFGNVFKSQQSNPSDGDLAELGYQTKKAIQENLQKCFGDRVANVGKYAASNIGKSQNSPDYISKAKDAIDAASSISKSASATSFKINKMRGTPLSKRLEKQFIYQVSRPNSSLGSPATLELGASLGFKHTTSLTYGLGISSRVGLGYGWENIRITFESVGLKTYTTYGIAFGICFYGGYERLYYTKVGNGNLGNNEGSAATHNNSAFSESCLIGLCKNYDLNTKLKGQVQALYDVWWRQKELSTPFIIRISSIIK